jgi:hypothetical protein
MLSALTGPLNHLTTPGKHFKWTEIENAAFEATKAALLNTAALSEPRYDRPFYLTTDASDWVLEQYDDDNAPRIVAMGGCRHRSPAEERYSIFELETLALKRALEHLQPLLDSNNHTTICRTDFKRCELDGKSSAMRAFVISMQHVDLDIELISGTDNPVADAVSRFNNFYRSEPVNICVIDDATTPASSSPASPPHTPPLDRPIPAVSPEVPRGEPSLPAAASTQRSTAEQANPEEEEFVEPVMMQSTLPSSTTRDELDTPIASSRLPARMRRRRTDEDRGDERLGRVGRRGRRAILARRRRTCHRQGGGRTGSGGRSHRRRPTVGRGDGGSQAPQEGERGEGTRSSRGRTGKSTHTQCRTTTTAHRSRCRTTRHRAASSRTSTATFSSCRQPMAIFTSDHSINCIDKYYNDIKIRRNDPSKVNNDRTDNSDDDNIKPTTAWAA